MTERRDLLFGDAPMSEWPSSSPPDDEEPWVSFVKARTLLGSDRQREGMDQLRNVLAMKGLGSRHYLQAWHFLRQAGAEPTTVIAKQVLGVIVEVGLERGTDIVAAYADGTARYENQSGALIVWDAPGGSLEPAIKQLLAAGQVVADQIGSWQDARPPAPRPGNIRINMLTPSGLHFGEADFGTLAADPLGGPVVKAALALMQQQIAETESGRLESEE